METSRRIGLYSLAYFTAGSRRAERKGTAQGGKRAVALQRRSDKQVVQHQQHRRHDLFIRVHQHLLYHHQRLLLHSRYRVAEKDKLSARGLEKVL